MSINYTKIEEIVHDYDAFLIDQFGVLLDGVRPYKGAIEALNYISSFNKPILLLSNSGKRTAPNIDRLIKLGFERSSFQTVLTSGEVAHHYLSQNIKRDTKIFLMSRDQDLTAIEQLDAQLVDDINAADMVIISGIDPWKKTIEQYNEMFKTLINKGIKVICSNPDFEMLTSNGIAFGSGQVAKIASQIGLEVQWIGKPYPMIYEHAMRLLDGIECRRVLCIGDSPEHDIIGGKKAKMATALVRTGLHLSLSDSKIMSNCEELGAVPTHYLKRFGLEN